MWNFLLQTYYYNIINFFQSRHKQKISNKESEIQTTKKEIAKIQKQINDANKSKLKLETLEGKFKTAEE